MGMFLAVRCNMSLFVVIEGNIHFTAFIIGCLEWKATGMSKIGSHPGVRESGGCTLRRQNRSVTDSDQKVFADIGKVTYSNEQNVHFSSDRSCRIDVSRSKYYLCILAKDPKAEASNNASTSCPRATSKIANIPRPRYGRLYISPGRA